MQLLDLQQRLQTHSKSQIQRQQHALMVLASTFNRGMKQAPEAARERLQRAALRLELLDPRLVLQRGFSWLSNAQGQALTSVTQTTPGEALHATLADGVVELQVLASRLF